jgi:hypothetical protein
VSSAPVSADAALFDAIADAAARESPLWGDALRPLAERERVAVFSPLVPDERFALGVETIYEGYLLHFGTPRLFAPADGDEALLLGDYLFAHGLVHVAATGSVDAVADLAELISLCAQARADGLPGDAAVWTATCALLGEGALGGARDALRRERDVRPLDAAARAAAGDAAVDRALAVHERLVG